MIDDLLGGFQDSINPNPHSHWQMRTQGHGSYLSFVDLISLLCFFYHFDSILLLKKSREFAEAMFICFQTSPQMSFQQAMEEKEDSRFDLGYYLSSHIPMVQESSAHHSRAAMLTMV